jgi:hypothetical protein
MLPCRHYDSESTLVHISVLTARPDLKRAPSKGKLDANISKIRRLAGTIAQRSSR